MMIGEFRFELPAWWSSVEVEVPESLTTEEQIADYVTQTCGRDTGLSDTWRQALKIWAIASARLSRSATYVAHCFRKGGEHAEAAAIYTAMWRMADKRAGGDRQLAAWYRIHLAYCAGVEYMELRNWELAAIWLGRCAKSVDSKDQAVRYYAGKAQEALAYVRRKMK